MNEKQKKKYTINLDRPLFIIATVGLFAGLYISYLKNLLGDMIILSTVLIVYLISTRGQILPKTFEVAR